MSEVWAPITSTSGISPAGQAVHKSETEAERKRKKDLFKSAMKKKGAMEEDEETLAAAAEENRDESASSSQVEQRGVTNGEHQVDFLA